MGSAGKRPDPAGCLSPCARAAEAGLGAGSGPAAGRGNQTAHGENHGIGVVLQKRSCKQGVGIGLAENSMDRRLAGGGRACAVRRGMRIVHWGLLEFKCSTNFQIFQNVRQSENLRRVEKLENVSSLGFAWSRFPLGHEGRENGVGTAIDAAPEVLALPRSCAFGTCDGRPWREACARHAVLGVPLSRRQFGMPGI